MEYIARHKIPKMLISIEYEDSEYINISSTYRWKDLQSDIMNTKYPVTIVYAREQTSLSL